MRQFLEIYFWQFWNQSTSEDKYDDQLNISTRGNWSNGFKTEKISKKRIDELNLISKLGGWLKTLPRIALISFLCVRFEKLIVVQLPILIQVVLLDRLSWSIFHEKFNVIQSLYKLSCGKNMLLFQWYYVRLLCRLPSQPPSLKASSLPASVHPGRKNIWSNKLNILRIQIFVFNKFGPKPEKTFVTFVM